MNSFYQVICFKTIRLSCRYLYVAHLIVTNLTYDIKSGSNCRIMKSYLRTYQPTSHQIVSSMQTYFVTKKFLDNYPSPCIDDLRRIDYINICSRPTYLQVCSAFDKYPSIVIYLNLSSTIDLICQFKHPWTYLVNYYYSYTLASDVWWLL